MEKVNLSIIFGEYYKLRIKISNDTLKKNFQRHFVTHDLIAYQIKKKNERGIYNYFLKRETKITELWEENNGCFYVDAGLIDYVIQWIQQQKNEYTPILTLDIPKTESVSLSDKWKSILRENQKVDLTLLTRYFGGLASQPTGYGKTTSLIALIDSLQGCSLILVPSRSILREVQLRGERYDVHIPEYDWKSRVNIINPVGFLRSKIGKTPEALEWLSTVNNVFTDEAHHLSANSWIQMFQKMPSVKRAYGFSASPETKEGLFLSPEECSLHRMGEKAARVIGMSGTTRVKRQTSVNVTLISLHTAISNEEIVNTLGSSWMDILDCLLTESKFAFVLKKCIFDIFPQVKFYIPIYKINSGLILYENLQKIGVRGIFWSGKEIRPQREDTSKEELDYIKSIIPQQQFLMTTSIGFEGVDLPNLSGVIPLTGKNYKNVMQTAGRSSRGDFFYVLVYDRNNWVITSQSKVRQKRIRKKYTIIETIKVGEGDCLK